MSVNGQASAAVPQRGSKWAWLQVVGLGFLMIGGIQTILANSGNFFVPVCEELGFATPDYAWWITCYAFGMAFSQLYVGKLWLKLNTPFMLTGSFLVCIGALALMGTYTELWQWYASGVVIGLTGGFFFMVSAPILVTNWFAKRAGFALGVVTIISAIGTAILSPVQAAVIAAFGWRAAYGIVALISCALVLPWTIFVLRYQPSDRGCKPVGWTEAMGTITAGDEEARGTTLKGGVLSVPFACIFLGAGLCALFGGYQNLWSTAAVSWGYDVQFGSYMISATALFGVCAPLIGLMIDKLGAYSSTFVVLVGQMVSGVCLVLFHGNPIAVLVFVFFFADQMTIVGTLVPLLVRLTFGARNYTKLLSFVQIGIGLIGGFSAPIVSSFFAAYGNFEASLWFGVGLAAACFVLFGIARLTKDRLSFESDDADGEREALAGGEV